MTVAALPSMIAYLEDGVTVTFAAPFRFVAGGLLVQRLSTAGVLTTLAAGVDYSVSGGATDAGGTVTLNSPVAGTTLRISRATPRAQAMDYATGDRFPAESHEGALDRAMLIDQEQDDRINDVTTRSLQVLPGQAMLPFNKGLFANKFLGFDAVGNPIPSVATGNDPTLRDALAGEYGAELIRYGSSTVGRVLSQSIDAEQFRVVGDTDLAVVQKALAAWVAQGGGTLNFHKRTYDLGAFAVGMTERFAIDGLRQAVLNGNGATFTFATSAIGPVNDRQPRIFLFRNFKDVSIRDLACVGTGVDLTVNWQGAKWFVPNDLLGACSGFNLHNVRVTGGVAGVQVQGAIDDITLSGNVIFDQCYYALTCVEGGSNIRGAYVSKDCRRSFFPYGVVGAKLGIRIVNTSTANGAAGAVLIKRYLNDTRNITLDLTFEGPLKYTNLVEFDHQPPDGTAAGVSKITGVDISYDLSRATYQTGFAAHRLSLQAYNDAGVLQTTSGHVIDGVTLRGDLGPLNPDGDVIVEALTQFARSPRIALDPGLKNLDLRFCNLKNVVLRPSSDRIVALKTGDLTAAPFAIDLSAFDTSKFQLIVRVTCDGDRIVLGGASSTVSEWRVLGFNAGGGPVSIDTAAEINKTSAGTAATVAIGGAGETMTVTVTGAPYANANSEMTVEVQILGKGAW